MSNINIRVVSSEGAAYVINAHGEVASIGDSIPSECGLDFDEYVRRALSEPFPYSLSVPVSRTINDLWPNRRLKFFQNGHWREGHVLTWEQWNTGPFSSTTYWRIELQPEAIGVGDVVTIEDLEKATQHNGKKGKILSYLEESGRYKVKLVDENSLLAIKLRNLKNPVLKRIVNRMNIDGGGTLLPERKGGELMSLQWLDPASPSIDLGEGLGCPMCRSIQPPLAQYESATLNETECPVCLETKECRVLRCNHAVCDPCWNEWRRAGSPGQLVGVTREEILQERAMRHEQYLSKIPHTYGGTATKPGDSEEKVKEAHAKLNEHTVKVVNKLIEYANSGEEGLRKFRRELLVEHVKAWITSYARSRFEKEIPTVALEIVQEVLEERRDDIIPTIKCLLSDDEDAGRITSIYISNNIHSICNRIGEKYKEAFNFRGAVPWYERCVYHAKKIADLSVGSQKYEKDATRIHNVATAYGNLAIAQKDAGWFSAALKSCDASLRVLRTDLVSMVRKQVLREMKEWTGNSGQLTPGC